MSEFKKRVKQKKCKMCPTYFTPKNSFQKVCSPKCAIEYAKQQRIKKNRKERRQKLPELYPTKYRGLLQTEVNKLAREIDIACGFSTCIDCGETLVGIGQVDAAHFHNSKNHGNIRYNLHNIHSARSSCNFYSDSHKQGYKQGLAKRYGKVYLERVKGLDKLYSDIKLTNKEVAEKLKIVRKINREFDTYKINDGISARDMFNEIIGIYKCQKQK